MLRKFAITLIIVAGLLIFLVAAKVYVVRKKGGGTLYWKSDEALLFIEVSSFGARMSYLQYALEPLLVSMGHVRPPDDAVCSDSLVIRITDKDLQRYTTNGYCFGHYVFFEGNIYTGQPAQRKLWKWTGIGFEPGTDKELRGFDPMKAASYGFQFDDVDGWSMREYALGHVTYPLTLGGRSLTLLSSGRQWPKVYDLSVDLVLPDQSLRRIWSLDERPHRVTKAEYERLFTSSDRERTGLDHPPSSDCKTPENKPCAKAENPYRAN